MSSVLLCSVVIVYLYEITNYSYALNWQDTTVVVAMVVTWHFYEA